MQPSSLLSSLFLYPCILSSAFFFSCYSQLVFQPLSLAFMSTCSLPLSFPSTVFSLSPCLPGFVIFCQPPPLSFSLCLPVCGLAPQCYRCWQWNTLTHQTLTRFMCSALARCLALQISRATCQVVHHKVEGAVDAGSLPDKLKRHLKQLALSQVQMICCFFGLVGSVMVIIDNMT